MEKKRELEDLGKLSKFYSEYMCEIVGEEDQLFKPNDFRYWDGELFTKSGDTFLKITSLNKVKFNEPIIKPVNVFLGIDPASSTKQTADYSVIMPVAFDSEKNIYTLPYFRKRVDPLRLTDAILEAIKTYRPKRGHIESTGYQEMLRQTVRARLREHNVILPGLEKKFNPRVEKSARLETLQPLFAQHKVFIKEGQIEFEDELMMYPRGKHEDTIDGFFYATEKMTLPYHIYSDDPVYSDDEKMFIEGYRERKQIGNWRVA
jgi:predicted phage terminase large subunit-like protein